MKSSDKARYAVLSAAGIPIPWWLAVVLTEVWRCGSGAGTIQAEYATVLLVAAIPVTAFIANLVVRAWKEPFPLRNWCISCCALAFAIAIYGVFAVVNQGGCDLGL